MLDPAVGTCVTDDTAVDTCYTGVTVIDAPDINADLYEESHFCQFRNVIHVCVSTHIHGGQSRCVCIQYSWERWTVNRGDSGPIPSTAVLKLSLRQFHSPHICLCLSEETLKACGPFYLVSMPGEVKSYTKSCWTLKRPAKNPIHPVSGRKKECIHVYTSILISIIIDDNFIDAFRGVRVGLLVKLCIDVTVLDTAVDTHDTDVTAVAGAR